MERGLRGLESQGGTASAKITVLVHVSDGGNLIGGTTLGMEEREHT